MSSWMLLTTFVKESIMVSASNEERERVAMVLNFIYNEFEIEKVCY
jgi:hypothetical protein